MLNRQKIRALTAALAISVTALTGVAATAPAATAAACSVAWGSGAKANGSLGGRQITNVRAGRHTCYDRLVIDLNAHSTHAVGYDVRYVSQVYQDGSGKVVPLRGGAKIQIVVLAPAYDTHGAPTYNPANDSELASVSAFSTFRQVAFAGSFEGQTTIGLGVRARLPMRAYRVDGPGHGQRLVIDVAHHW
jgi:hypothetical protein